MSVHETSRTEEFVVAFCNCQAAAILRLISEHLSRLPHALVILMSAGYDFVFVVSCLSGLGTWHSASYLQWMLTHP
ncbi:hypothetical protein DFH07DRAFT_826894 [Mycena maculata]|uniref:Uncharacterized protein n=1 Tax=Mycena maculata TaxID=230809 RepID=A0AAD7NAB3_9AGAR|nr:hypothetical protein DFH07DRAFT_826894 [Mycena maculata]